MALTWRKIAYEDDVIVKTTLTAKGNLISASAASTPVALAVGTDGKVLVADSAEISGLNWATVGAASIGASTDNKVARYNGTDAIQGSDVTIDDTGNVGIGTTAPSGLLNIKGNLSSALTGTVAVTNLSTAVVGTTTVFTTELAVGDSIKIGTETFTVSVITDALNLTLDSAYQGVTASGLTGYSDPSLLAIDNGDAVNKLTVTKSGNVGIGTTSPTTAKLVITTPAGEEGLDLATADSYANLRVIRNSLSTIDKNMYIGYNSGANSALRLYSNNAVTLTVAAGKVGIGTTNPIEKLNVSGNILATGTICGTNKEIFKTANADSPLTAAECAGTVISNYGMTDADCTIDLPTAVEGLAFVCILPAVRARFFKLHCPTAQADRIWLLGVAGSYDGNVGVASGYTIASACSFFTFKAVDAGYDWFAIPLFGDWVAS